MEEKRALVVLTHQFRHVCQGRSVLLPLLPTCGFKVEQSFSLNIKHPALFSAIYVDAAYLQQTEHFALLNALAAQSMIVVFNAQSDDKELEHQALCHNIRGVLNEDDSADLVLKAINIMATGQLWFSRGAISDVLYRMLQQVGKQEKQLLASNEAKQLTKRERTIIVQLSAGARNKEIADKLNISPHTVKTHLYSIFRKTKSRNRVELLSWAKMHIAEA